MLSGHGNGGAGFSCFRKKRFTGTARRSLECKIDESRATQCDSHSPLGLKRFRSSVHEARCPARAMEEESVGHHVQAKKSRNWPWHGLMEKFTDRETRQMQAERHRSAWS